MSGWLEVDDYFYSQHTEDAERPTVNNGVSGFSMSQLPYCKGRTYLHLCGHHEATPRYDIGCKYYKHHWTWVAVLKGEGLAEFFSEKEAGDFLIQVMASDLRKGLEELR